MAVAFRALGTGAFYSGLTPIAFPGYPAGAATGDIIFWAVGVTTTAGGTPPTFSAPSGWTTDADVVVDSGGSNPHRLLLYRKNSYTSGDASPGNLGASVTAQDSFYTQTAAYSGATGIATVNTASGLTGGASVTTPARGAGLELAVFSQAGNSSGTPGTNYTERFDTAGSPNPTLLINDGPASGTSTTETFTTTTRPWAAAAVHLIDTSAGAFVGAALSGVTFPLRHAGLGPFISSGGNVYYFGRDSVNTGQVEPHKASDPTSSFTAQTLKTMSSATSTAIEAMACYQVGQVIHVVAQISTGATYYNFYTMDTDTWGLTTSETAVAAASFAPSANYTFVSLVVRSGGEVVIVYCAGLTAMASGFHMVRYTRRTATNTFSAPVNVDNGGSVDWSNGVAVLGASDRVHFFLKSITALDLFQRTLTAANALQTFPSAFEVNAATPQHPMGMGVSWASGGSTLVAVPYVANGPIENLALLTSGDAPTPSVTSSIGAIAPNFLTGQRLHGLSVDTATVHLTYADLTSDDLYHDNDSGTNTWGTDVLELAGTVTAITSNVYTRSGRKLAMVVNDGGTIKYAEIDLSPAIHRRLVSRAALIRSNRY